MFGKKKGSKSVIDFAVLVNKLNAIEELLEDIQDDIKKVDIKVSKLEDKLANQNEVESLKGEIRQKSKFIEELLLKMIQERPRDNFIPQPPYNPRYNGYNKHQSSNPNVAGPQGKLPG